MTAAAKWAQEGVSSTWTVLDLPDKLARIKKS